MQKAHHYEVVKGPFQQAIYSPHGTVEGVTIETVEGIVQLVFPDDADTSAFRGLTSGALVVANCTFVGWSSTRAGGHRVYDVGSIVSIGGKKPKAAKKVKRVPAYSGMVVSINYARHGEANGVVIDSGDFIHMRPEGFKRLKLRVGDFVEADGDGHALDAARGYVVEATRVNGKTLL